MLSLEKSRKKMIIRKISIGTDYKSSMHYLQGQEVLDKSYKIHLMKFTDIGSIQIFIERDDEVVLWKEINPTVPTVIEYDISF